HTATTLLPTRRSSDLAQSEPPGRCRRLHESHSEARGCEIGEGAVRDDTCRQAVSDPVQHVLADGGALDLPGSGNAAAAAERSGQDRKSTRLNSSHQII